MKITNQQMIPHRNVSTICLTILYFDTIRCSVYIHFRQEIPIPNQISLIAPRHHGATSICDGVFQVWIELTTSTFMGSSVNTGVTIAMILFNPSSNALAPNLCTKPVLSPLLIVSILWYEQLHKRSVEPEQLSLSCSGTQWIPPHPLLWHTP